MKGLRLYITDLQGNDLGSPQNWWDTQVEIPLNDSRLAHTTISIYDPVLGAGGENVTPGDHMLKVIYGDHLIFWGQILTPVWNAAQNEVQIQAHDPTIRLKRHFHRYGDFVVGTQREGGYPLNGMGARLLVLSAFPTDRQQGLGWPHPGIYFGIDVTTDFSGRDGPMPSYPRPDKLSDRGAGDAYWRTVERGTNVWESLQDAMRAVEGFDIDFVPVDRDHPPQTNLTGSGAWISKTWRAGFYVQMNCWIKQGNDRTRSNIATHGTVVDGVEHPYGARNVIFQCGFGRDNLENFIFRPDASAMRNYAGVHTPGGQKDKGDRPSMAHVWVQDSAERYGQYHEWATSNQKGDRDLNRRILKAKAKYITAAYGYPPQFFDIELSPERRGGAVEAEEPFRFGDHFWVGDYITAEVKEGELHVNLDARITKATLTQAGPQLGTTTNLECVPKALESLGEITESNE